MNFKNIYARELETGPRKHFYIRVHTNIIPNNQNRANDPNIHQLGDAYAEYGISIHENISQP